MKNWLINKIFKSKKFWYTLSAILVPIIATNLGVDTDTATKIFWAFVALTGAQGVADLGIYMKK